MLINSFHFIPLNKPEYFPKVEKLESEYYILDLEDSVPENDKEIARKNLIKFFGGKNNHQFFIRINTDNEEHFKEDLELINQLEWGNLLIPKISYDLARRLKSELNYTPNYFLLFESIQSIYFFDKIVNVLSPISHAGIGFEDILTEFVYEKDELLEFIHNISAKFIFNCKAFNIKCIDGICTNKNSAIFKQECQNSKSLGFDGKMSIYPYQIELINDSWKIPKNKYLSAIKLVETYSSNENIGYLIIDNKIVSPAKLKHAKLIIEEYEKI